MKRADLKHAKYVLAQDPDADRFAAAEKRCEPPQWITQSFNVLWDPLEMMVHGISFLAISLALC